jgi:hypothetical protein
MLRRRRGQHDEIDANLAAINCLKQRRPVRQHPRLWVTLLRRRYALGIASDDDVETIVGVRAISGA